MNVVSEINRALEFVKTKKYKSAENIYFTLMTLNPDNTVILSFWGYLYLSWKKFGKAEKIFEKAFSISKTNSVIEGMALVKYSLSKYEEAVSLYQQLLKYEPKYEYYEKITTSLSNLVSLKGDKHYARMAYLYAIEGVNKYPLSKELLLNLSIACIYTGRLQEGEEYCKKSLKLDSKYADAWSHMGYINEALYCDEMEAQNCHKKAIKYKIGASGFYDLGISYSKSGQYSMAARYLNKAYKLMPRNKAVMLALAINNFRQRKFKQGYKYYIQQNDSSRVTKLKKLWDGKKHQEKTIFVYPDLAYGDHIMFMRYVPFLKEKFKKVKVFAYPQLFKLFHNNFDGIEFVQKIPQYDYSVALSKLPYYLKIDFEHIPFSEGYLVSGKKDIKNSKLKVGICWEAGNIDIRSTIHRSINIDEFSELFKKNFEFYSFQVNPSRDDYQKYNMIDLGKTFKDFNDTASYLETMDVVISVDTSVANLAGALGVKTLMLIPYYSDWRWFDNTEKTEWYDSVKIFKQTEKNSWSNEINRIINELTVLSEK